MGLLSQAITGINSVVFYSTTIFGLAGFSQAIIGTSLVGAINVGATILTSRLIDTTGRKVLLLIGTSVM
jgi:SP family facilitated glucose transporter-like MFS transporter 8